MTGRRRLRIVRLGAFARMALNGATEARLIGIFERSLHVSIGDAIVGIVESGLGNGPLNAVLASIDDEPEQGGWPRLAGQTGARTQITGRELTVGALAFDFADAAPWQPAPWPPTSTPQTLHSCLGQLVRIADRDAPADGLSRLVLCTPDRVPDGSLIARAAAPRLAALNSWIGDQIADCFPASSEDCTKAEAASVPTTLLGLGPGLTPSGDDVLCGALIALDALAYRRAAAALGEAVVRDATTATTALSRSFLAAAAKGQGAEALHVLIAAMLSRRIDQIEPLVGDVARIGHTSGWDALAGAALVLRAFSPSTSVRRRSDPWG